jgi:hypothetical protein
MAKEIIIDSTRDALNSDWLRGNRIMNDKTKSKAQRERELAELELEELVPFEDLED